MKTAFLIVFILCGAGAAIGWQHGIITQQRAALEIWQNCPMPVAGTMLVIEADWPDKKPEDKYRCSVAHKRAPLPKKLLQGLPRRDS